MEAQAVNLQTIEQLCKDYFNEFPNKINVDLRDVPDLRNLLTSEQIKYFDEYRLREQSLGTVHELRELALEFREKFPAALSRNMTACIKDEEDFHIVLSYFKLFPKCEEKKAFDEYLRRSDELMVKDPSLIAHDQLDQEFSGKFPDVLITYNSPCY